MAGSAIGLGTLGVVAAAALVFSFLTLLLSPLAFTAMYRLSEILAVLWVVAWVVCLVQAFTGRAWRMPSRAALQSGSRRGHRRALRCSPGKALSNFFTAFAFTSRWRAKTLNLVL